MLVLTFFMALLPALVVSSSEGNIHLLEEEVAEAIRACTYNESDQSNNQRYSRSNKNTSNQYYQYPHIDKNTKNTNIYNHERRNTSDMMTPKNLSTIIDDDLLGYEGQYENENFNNTRTNFSNLYNNNNNLKRSKRNEKLLENYKEDQCLSQCVFTNLHVVDNQGIPREAKLWNKIQTEVTSQQSRVLLQDQVRSCFQELQFESEDNDCSYSNKLERCLMLRFSDRIKGTEGKKQS